MSNADKTAERSKSRGGFRWEINFPLLLKSSVALVLTMTVAGFLYWKESSTLSSSLLEKSHEAEDREDWDGQIKWLNRYRMLHPNDLEAVTSVALAADKAVEIPPANRVDRVTRAETLLSDAMAAHARNDEESSVERADHIKDLRRRLIRRQMQFGGRFADEIESQIVLLNAAENDPEILRSLALSRAVQYALDPSEKRDPDKFRREQNYWMWLSQQPVGDVVYAAWNANRDDIQLAAQVIDLCDRAPEKFTTTSPSTDKSSNEIAEEVAAHLATHVNDGQAVLVLSLFERKQDASSASRLIESNAEKAIDRLENFGKEESAKLASGEASDDSRSIQTLPPADSSPNAYDPRWDFELAFQSASNLLSDNPKLGDIELAMDRIDRLIRLPDLGLSGAVIEPVYLVKGQQLWLAGEEDSAIELWKEGIDRLADDSLKLHLIYASSLTEIGDLQPATSSIDDLSDLVGRLNAANTGASGARLSSGQRASVNSDLDQANWVVRLLKGRIALRKGDLNRATELLQGTLDSQIPVSNAQRIQAANFLAQAYKQAGIHDLAATSYERAISLGPQNDQYRALAAESWMRAGDRSRAVKQWQAVTADSPQLAVVRAQSIVNEQLLRPALNRDFEMAERAIDQASKLLDEIPADEETEKQRLAAQLALLKISTSSVASDDQPSITDRFAALAERYPENPDVLSSAAINMAAAGDKVQAAATLEALGVLVGTSNLQFQQSSAQLAAIGGESQKGIDSLTQHAQSNPDDALACLQLAANLARNSGSSQKAYQLLQEIPESQWSPELLMEIFTLSLILESSPNPGSGNNESDGLSAKSWEDRLRKLEGEGGTWWRLAQATRLLAEASRFPKDDSNRKRLLQQAAVLHGSIQSKRPRWCFGHTLEGKIAAYRGQPTLAIESLRRGIATGDARASTMLLLISQLNAANRTDEADAEFARFERLADTNSVVTSLAIDLAGKRGNLGESVALARSNAESNSDSASAWLLLAQTASRAALAAELSSEKSKFAEEAKSAINLALKNSGNSSAAAYQILLSLQSELGEKDHMAESLEKAAKSNIAEPQRSLFVGSNFVKLENAAAALPHLERALRISPNDPDVYTEMANYYTLVGSSDKNIAMLEKALELAPTRSDARNRLALAIALRDGAEVPWKRLSQLLEDDDSQSSKNQLLHALILLNRGDEDRQEEAAKLLRRIIRIGGDGRDDASRMLAALESRRWLVARSAEDVSERERSFAAAKQLYQDLVQESDPQAMDLYRYGTLLLEADRNDDAKRVIDQLDRLATGTAIVLDLQVRLADQLNQHDELDAMVERWVQGAVSVAEVADVEAWDRAGWTLTKYGFDREALKWFTKAFEEDPSYLRGYVGTLRKQGDFDGALQACLAHYKEQHDPVALVLLCNVLNWGERANEVSNEINALLESALLEFAESSDLFEAVGTLRLGQERYPEAIDLYERAEKLSPRSVAVLNNVAMALSEVPGREPEAIGKIQKAIDMYGRVPELLDTQGIVLLRNDRMQQAINVLREATELSDDPRFRLHLLMALSRAGFDSKAFEQWNQLDLPRLKESVLTPAERSAIKELETEYRQKPSPAKSTSRLKGDAIRAHRFRHDFTVRRIA